MRRFGGAVLLVAGLLTSAAPAAHADNTINAAVHPYRPTSSLQILVVNAPAMNTTRATLSAYAWTGAEWQLKIGPLTATIGANGLTMRPRESDYFTPIGQYNITTIFGSGPDPGTLFPYRRATSNDHWVDDPASPLYNTWQVGPAAGRWNSAETLSNYQLAAGFDFNQDPVLAGGDSAIFLHAGTSATLGCVALASQDLLEVLTWLDPTAQPQIIIGANVTLPVHVDPAPNFTWRGWLSDQLRMPSPQRPTSQRTTPALSVMRRPEEVFRS